MNKKELYESIMKNVAREVKKALNENSPFIDGKKKYIICDQFEEKEINELIDIESEEIGSELKSSDYETIYLNEDAFKLAGMVGYLSGDIKFYVSIYAYDNYDDPDHHWTEYEVTDVKLISYDIEFTDDETNLSYTVYLNGSDYKKSVKHNNIEDTEVKRNYDNKQRQEKEEKDRKEVEEINRRHEKYVADVKANPEKYIKLAEELLDKAAKHYSDYWAADEASDIYEILGMKKESEDAHRIAVYQYHRDEAASGLL